MTTETPLKKGKKRCYFTNSIHMKEYLKDLEDDNNLQYLPNEVLNNNQDEKFDTATQSKTCFSGKFESHTAIIAQTGSGKTKIICDLISNGMIPQRVVNWLFMQQGTDKF